MIRKRLNDREQRNKKSLGRKQVFLLKGSTGNAVEIQFGQSYRSLFEKTVEAFSQLPRQYIGEMISVNQEGLTLQVSYLGEAIDPVSDNLHKISNFLRSLQSEKPRQRVFNAPRYISSLYKQNEDPKIGALIEYIDNSSLACTSGYGISDPVISNFTEDEDGVHLVDLDHFCADISLYYQLGFVAADIDIISNQTYKSSESLLDIFNLKNDNLDQGDITALISGYISRLAIDAINDNLGLDSYRSQQSLEHIYALAKELIEPPKTVTSS